VAGSCSRGDRDHRAGRGLRSPAADAGQFRGSPPRGRIFAERSRLLQKSSRTSPREVWRSRSFINHRSARLPRSHRSLAMTFQKSTVAFVGARPAGESSPRGLGSYTPKTNLIGASVIPAKAGIQMLKHQRGVRDHFLQKIISDTRQPQMSSRTLPREVWRSRSLINHRSSRLPWSHRSLSMTRFRGQLLRSWEPALRANGYSPRGLGSCQPKTNPISSSVIPAKAGIQMLKHQRGVRDHFLQKIISDTRQPDAMLLASFQRHREEAAGRRGDLLTGCSRRRLHGRARCHQPLNSLKY